MIWLTNNWRSLLWLLLAACVVIFGSIAHHYHTKYASAASLAEQRQETINDLQRRQKSVAALDQKYTKELADAQKTISDLHRDVDSGRRRLQLNATCQKQFPIAATGMDDAASPGLTDAAERDYFTLRSRIETVTKQLTGLQAFVREQCFK
ncbi:lysis protein [Pantoea sp. FN0307]|uniref:lysis protein n=1 Tax=unclassified Pantoea TaxID=2630326 RepID=UPI003CF605C0